MLTLPLQANAQSKPQLNVVIEELDSEARECGISADSLRSIANLTLRNNGIQATDLTSVNLLYVNFNVMYLASIKYCAFAAKVRVEGYATEDFTMRKLNGFASRKRTTNLCDKSGVAIYRQDNASTASLTMVESYIKLCLGELTY